MYKSGYNTAKVHLPIRYVVDNFYFFFLITDTPMTRFPTRNLFLFVISTFLVKNLENFAILLTPPQLSKQPDC